MWFVAGLILGIVGGFYAAAFAQSQIEKQAEQTKKIRVRDKYYKLEELKGD